MDVVREATENGAIIDIPRQFGKYTYIRTLGCASNSIILLVEDRSHYQYAVKVVSRSFLASQGQLEHFERELRLLQFIQHPNIIRLMDVVYAPDTIALVMEHCENGDLFEFLWHHGPIPVAMCRSYLVQLLKALECFHEKGYAHRDIKPENVLIDGRARVKLCDLGLARASGNDGMMQTICGTIPYTPPEIVQGLPYEGAKADIWSLGILTFVMVTGRLPWASEDRAGMMREILDGHISFPPEFCPELRTFVRYCTSVNPADRPTATELLDIPWVAEEIPAYNKMFGLPGRVATVSSSEGWAGPKGQNVARQSARMILMRPHHRSLSADRARQMGGTKSETSRGSMLLP
jgi:serine/threonine protein kinase